MSKIKDRVDEYTDKLVMDFVKDKGLQDHVVIFSGRFQPFSVHHLKVYNHLVENFGEDNVYIATSNKVDLIKSPLNFEEKKKIIEKHGIKNIYQVENPYVANEILKNFNDRTTAVTYVISDKDSDRLKDSDYYKEFDGTIEQSFRENAYVYRVPENKIENNILSGTTIRKALGDGNISKKEKKKMFEKYLGFYDEDIFNMLVEKFSSINEVLNDFLQYYDINILNIFNENNDVSQINELSRTNILDPDDGPGMFIGNYQSYKSQGDDLAFRVGYEIIDYMTGGYFTSIGNDYRNVNSVSYFPVGIETSHITPEKIQKWVDHVQKLALPTGYSYFEFMDYLNNLNVNENQEESNLVSRARDELKRAGLYDADSDYNGMLAHAVLDLIKKFSSQEHSGASAVMTSELFRKLANWETLTPLTSNPDEWTKVTGDGDSQQEMWQNTRDPRYFSFDRGKTYWNVDENVLYDTYKSFLKENAVIYNRKNKINEGGLAGHINHPFEDLNLTFLDIKNLIQLGLSGNLSFELDATEKIDGQNLYITYVDREIKAARNKKEMKTPLSKDDIKEKFKDRPGLVDAFYFAMQDMENFISSFSDDSIIDLFDNGESFLNIEVYYPDSKNVIDYDKARLVFHDFVCPFSESDTYVDEKNKYLLRIRDMITNVNNDIRTNFEITPPVFVNINQSNDFSNMRGYFINRLRNLMDEYDLSYENKIEDYIYKKFEYEVTNNINNYNLNFSNDLIDGIIKWLIDSNNKPMNISEIEKKVGNDAFMNWLRNVDRSKKFKEFIQPLEVLILELGNEILKNVSGFLNTDNDQEIIKLKNDISKTIDIIKNSNNIDDISMLTKNLEKLNKIGGLDSIIPSEGVVFKYRGKLYKITGSFAPVNKILGILKYKNSN